MREIKFRRWQSLNDKMDYDLDNVTVRSLNWPQWCHPNNQREFIYMEWTGLKDKNGVDIYEGDLVRFDYNPAIPCVVDDPILGEFIYIQYHEMGEDNIKEDCEVIGNIYANPELLERKS